MKPQLVELDVREEILKGCEPFSKIMSAVAPLEAGDQLLLIAPFEPVPLFEVLKKQGFRHTKRPTDSGDWEVLFTRESICVQEKPHNSVAVPPTAPSSTVDVDARGLEPPQPLVKILEAAAGLPEGAMLRARTDRRPMHLYAHLADRGFTSETQEQPDGSFLTQVWR